jgi:hypothetical protein
MNCEHREMEGHEHSSRIGPKCHRDAVFTYEWNGDEVAVCEMHSEDVRGVELMEVDDV